MASPSTKRRAVTSVEQEDVGGKAAACRALGMARSAACYLPQERVEGRRLRREIIGLSQKHPRYGYRRIMALLRREGWAVKAKRVQRVRRQEGFQVCASEAGLETLRERQMLEIIARQVQELALLRRRINLLVRKVFGASSEKLGPFQFDLFLLQAEAAPGEASAFSILEETQALPPRRTEKTRRDRQRWPEDYRWSNK